LVVSTCAQWSLNATTVLGDAAGISGNDLAHLYYPRGLAIDKNDQVHVADCGNHRILRITSSGSIESIGTNQLLHPTDMVFDQYEQLYVLESGYQRVLLFPANSINSTSNVTVGWGHGSGGGTDQLAWYEGYTSAGLAIDINTSTLYVSDMENQRISMWLLNGTNGTIVDGVTGVADAAINHLSSPQSIIFDNISRLWIADFGNNRVVTLINGSSPTIQVVNVSGVAGLKFDSAGTLYIVEGNRNQVSRWRSDWNRTECILACNNGVSGTSAAQLNSPERVEMDSFGNLIISDTVNHRIQKFFLIDNSPCGMC
jgi:sugar lactone lactonase YvrE